VQSPGRPDPGGLVSVDRARPGDGDDSAIQLDCRRRSEIRPSRSIGRCTSGSASCPTRIPTGNWGSKRLAGLELFSAFLYFAAIAIVVGARIAIAAQVFLLALYCLVYTLPLFAIAVVRLALGLRAEALLRPRSIWLFARWPLVVAPLAACLGTGLAVYGAVRLSSV
jgi:hypothetical protein